MVGELICLLILASRPMSRQRLLCSVSPVPGGMHASQRSNAAPTDNGSAQGKNDIVYALGKGIKPPVAVFRPKPPYTQAALKAGLRGHVVLKVTINKNGRVVDLHQVSKPLGMGLDKSARQTVRAWKFKPATRKGVPVSVRCSLEIFLRPN